MTRRWINGMLISLLDWDEETGELDKTTIVPLIDGQNWFYLEIFIEFLADLNNSICQLGVQSVQRVVKKWYLREFNCT